MFNVPIGKYIPLNSEIHKMNPISKIICLLLFLVLLFFDDVILLIILTVLTLTLLILSKVPLKLYFNSINNLKVLFVFFFIITLIFKDSWYVMIITIVKIILGILYTMILTYTTSKSEITYGLEKVFSPLSILKVPVKQMALSLTLALRFVPTIFDQTNKILKSQASRGIDFRHSSIKGKIVAISSMVVPMFILTSKKADAVADSMEVRLYDHTIKRTSYRYNKWHSFDDNLVVFHIGLLMYYVLKAVLS